MQDHPPPERPIPEPREHLCFSDTQLLRPDAEGFLHPDVQNKKVFLFACGLRQSAVPALHREERDSFSLEVDRGALDPGQGRLGAGSVHCGDSGRQTGRKEGGGNERHCPPPGIRGFL